MIPSSNLSHQDLAELTVNALEELEHCTDGADQRLEATLRISTWMIKSGRRFDTVRCGQNEAPLFRELMFGIGADFTSRPQPHELPSIVRNTGRRLFAIGKNPRLFMTWNPVEVCELKNVLSELLEASASN